jgi:enamine deaminase RidA (YjgF/YER057c/UK114 family)
MRIPYRITAGDTVNWTEFALTDPQGNAVTSADYTLTFSIRGPVALTPPLDVGGTPNGTGWDFTITTAQTASLNATNKPALWYWQATAVNGPVQLIMGSGQLGVAPNLAAIAGVLDGRSNAKQILDQIETTIQARLSGNGVQEYTIGGRATKYMNMADLLALRSHYQLIVANERRAERLKNGLGAPDRIGVRFR